MYQQNEGSETSFLRTFNTFTHTHTYIYIYIYVYMNESTHATGTKCYSIHYQEKINAYSYHLLYMHIHRHIK